MCVCVCVCTHVQYIYIYNRHINGEGVRVKGAAAHLVIFGALPCKRLSYSNRTVGNSNHRITKEVAYGKFMK